MKNINEKRFKNIFTSILSVIVIIIGALFIYHIFSIYLTGDTRDQIYTKEIVVAHLSQMIIPLIILLVLIIIGEVFYKLFENNKSSYKNKSREFISGYIKEIDFKNYSSEIENEINEIKNYEKKRLIAIAICSIPCLVAFVFALIYAINTNNFLDNDPNGSVIKMALYFIPFIIIFFASIISYSYYEEYLAKKELKHVIKVIAYNKKNNFKKLPKESWFNKIFNNRINITRLIVLVTSITFIVVGLIDGQGEDVLKKAIMICTECIGLG